mgnify:FL=1
MTVVLLIVIVSIMFIKAAKRIRHRTSLARASNRGCRYMLYSPSLRVNGPADSIKNVFNIQTGQCSGVSAQSRDHGFQVPLHQPQI